MIPIDFSRGIGLKEFTVASHQGAIQILWLRFWRAVMSSLFTNNLWSIHTHTKTISYFTLYFKKTADQMLISHTHTHTHRHTYTHTSLIYNPKLHWALQIPAAYWYTIYSNKSHHTYILNCRHFEFHLSSRIIGIKTEQPDECVTSANMSFLSFFSHHILQTTSLSLSLSPGPISVLQAWWHLCSPHVFWCN